MCNSLVVGSVPLGERVQWGFSGFDLLGIRLAIAKESQVVGKV